MSDGDAIELDLARGRLLELGAAAATRARAEVVQSGAPLAAWCAGSNCDLRTVLATVDGDPVTLLVDTGSSITALYADSDAGIGATMRATARVALDDRVDAALAPDAIVQVAGATVKIRRLGVLPRLETSLPPAPRRSAWRSASGRVGFRACM